MKKVSKSIEIDGKKLTLEIGKLAGQANMAVLGRLGDTVVLVTVVSSKYDRDLGFFPLTVEYIERLYAGGRIKGSRWVKREGRASDEAILKARLIDRSIRPLFPKGYKKEVQVIVTILSVDQENDPDILSIIATGAALHLSDIPWNGPIAAVRVGYFSDKENGHFLLNPLASELEYSDLDMIVSGTKEKVIMFEGSAKEIPEDKVLKAVSVAQEGIKKAISLINTLRKEAGKKKQVYVDEVLSQDLEKNINKDYRKKIEKALLSKNRKAEIGFLKDEAIETYKEEFEKKQISKIFDEIFKKTIRERVLSKGIRFDGRKANDIREIRGEVGVLPRTHGSAIFERGETQALTVVTLASPSLEQYLESPMGEVTKKYMHHYYMPPYSVGETGRLGWPKRREVGHGALAERALLPVLPAEEKFPYTIRVVTEVTSSNGSTSMAAVSGSVLSLMDAGVPIKEPVAGIAIGLMTREHENTRTREQKGYVVLTDILGIEDFFGDMDFKAAGTKNGITALQLDVKIDGLTDEILKEAFEKAKIAREYIIGKMMTVLSECRGKVSQFAPKIKILKISVSKIGALIGPGGKNIRGIIAKTDASVDVEEDGTVNVTAPNEEALKQAIEMVEGFTKEVKVDELYEGEVKRILPFGAFVEVFPGKEGLVHVSKMTTRFVKTPEEVVKIGDKVKVKVVEIDNQGRVNLTMLLDAKPDSVSRRPSRPPRSSSQSSSRPPFRKRY
ncbi:polyribonucleotide nucleotidyltransferase [Candidatus Microgenomates bacterium]|nr:polyribonucleotide nucleotidyltransferase [Candidatus Microgenomates bacterium]